MWRITDIRGAFVLLLVAAPLLGCGGGGGAEIGRVEAVQPALLAGAPLRVALEGADDDSVQVSAELLAADGAPVPLGEASVSLARGRGTAKIVPGDGADQALSRCEEAEVRVTVRPRPGDDVIAERTVELRRAPPTCGRFFAGDSVWNAELPDDARLDPASGELVEELHSAVRANLQAGFGPELNIEQFGVSLYTVGAGQPTVPVELDREGDFTEGLRRAFRAVPIPEDARPAQGTDRHLVVWQPSTDTLWEFFGLRREDGRWTAIWGGRIQGVSDSPGVFEPRPDGVKWGGTATGLALVGGLITGADLRRGRIDHALAFAIPKARAGEWSLPAQRTDGEATGERSIPEGAHFRLDPRLDLDSLGLAPLIRMMAEAAQRYGIILRDQSGVVSFYGEDRATSRGPRTPELLDGQAEGWAIGQFPWRHLQLLEMDLRRGEG